MKFKYRKTGLYGIGVIIVLYFIMVFLYYREVNPKFPFMEEYVVEIPQNEILDGLNSYKVEDEKIISTSNDAWLKVQLNNRSYIKQIQIYSKFVENSGEKIQTYYTSSEEFESNVYVSTILDNGKTNILMNKDEKAKSFRIDLTNKSDVVMDMPQVQITIINKEQNEFWIMYLIILLVCLVILVVDLNKNFVKDKIYSKQELKKIYEFVDQVISLAISDFRSRFSGSYLGIVWGILQPLSTILLFWFVFQVGFRSKPMGNVPFILWLTAGMIPWNYFYDGWFGGTNAFTSYGYIVKKVVFKIEILPFIKVLSSFFLNIIFNGLLILIYFLYGYFPGIHILDMIYFSICLFCLSLGLSYLTATLNVFMKDIGQLMGIVLQFLMWLTPMMWDYRVAEKYSWIYKYNPLHYVLNGYRESLINNKWFFENRFGTIWFWSVTLFFLILGTYTMKKLKPHFADVL